MSYYGSPYAGTGNYDAPSDAAAAAARPSYDNQTYPTGQHEANAEAYGNHGMIPGLALGFTLGGSAPNGPPKSTYGTQSYTHAAPSAHVDGDSQPSAPNNAPAIDDDMDEGEIDEGELDDVYEPSWHQPEITAVPPGPHGASTEDTHGDTSPDAERGSYSPYLSPQEIQPDSTKSSGPQSPAQTNLLQHPPATSPQALADARKEAMDAVLRLWPLKVRFSDYIQAGIDEGVMRELFANLGFDPSDTSAKVITGLTDAPKASVRDVPNSVPSPAPVMDSTKESAETRKDRIARRLAASKGTDRPAASPELAKGASTPAPKPQAAPASKAKLDKSKLLQQKMEALKKARESKQGTTPQRSDGAVRVTSSEVTPQPQSTTKSTLDDNTVLSRENAEDRQAESVVRLAAPPLSPPPAATGPSKRPVASDLNELSDAPFKRPFGQSRQPEKFLIDVSDDEDDEAMDLDSPEIRPASVNKTNSPFRIPSFPETQFSFMGRQMSSPMAAPRAPASGDDDLEAKLTDIADLKRRIAEREAEMKAKTSRPASPAVGSSTAPPRATSVTSVSVALGSEANASSLLGTPLKTKPPADFDGSSQRLSKPSELRQSEGPRARSGRSASRIASERLIAESQARRREKELKLQFMKSQMLKMEKEISDSLQAEERMKAEAPDESEGESEEQAPETTQEQSALHNPDSEPSGPSLAHGADVMPPPDDPLQDRNVAGPVEEEELESDAAAAMSSSEEAMDTVEEPSEESGVARLSESSKSGSRPLEEDPSVQHPGTQESESPGIDTPDAEIDEPMSDVDPAVAEVDEAQNLPTEADNAVSSDSSSDGGEDEEDEGEMDEDPEEEVGEDQEASASKASPEATVAPATERQNAPSVSTGDSDSESQSDFAGASVSTPLKQPISTGQAESKPASPREPYQHTTTAEEGTAKADFTPYESFLKNFRAYRFHPDFANSVPGGLRSLTYSNGIDPKLPLCPDELAGEQCPRGNDCIYQHFDKLQAPDDQILMQLGEYGNYEGEHKAEFNKGLRAILADAREKKIRDFDTLARSIIDYRREFRKDPYKVLPLGDVKL